MMSKYAPKPVRREDSLFTYEPPCLSQTSDIVSDYFCFFFFTVGNIQNLKALVPDWPEKNNGLSTCRFHLSSHGF